MCVGEGSIVVRRGRSDWVVLQEEKLCCAGGGGEEPVIVHYCCGAIVLCRGGAIYDCCLLGEGRFSCVGGGTIELWCWRGDGTVLGEEK